MFFIKGDGKAPIPELTPQTAQTIYGLFKNRLDETQIHAQGYHPIHISVVKGEYLRLEGEAIQLMQGEEVPDSVDILIAGLQSNLLNIGQVVVDLIEFYPTFDTSRTWQQFYEVFVPPPPPEPEIDEREFEGIGG